VQSHRQTYGGQARQPGTSYVGSKFIGVPTNLDVTRPTVELRQGGHVASKFVGRTYSYFYTVCRLTGQGASKNRHNFLHN
jgi:hypothetical protein